MQIEHYWDLDLILERESEPQDQATVKPEATGVVRRSPVSSFLKLSGEPFWATLTLQSRRRSPCVLNGTDSCCCFAHDQYGTVCAWDAVEYWPDNHRISTGPPSSVSASELQWASRQVWRACCHAGPDLSSSASTRRFSVANFGRHVSSLVLVPHAAEDSER
ncbi:hypothetical protein K458DRAFT_391875 [Lentithecium fluviatile CBS 122367]|uniref:Uncharacterized protein n=1 Tax=Lentithecium fluviatile CBS 122367 TaxID=1168545 RepID=A0A6G1IU69_9PLEO|nr:hypothetical protein K458DRAFT_391875 [Lentithecium fluviatile CBS 122367]